MTIYTISVITSTGYPYYNLKIKDLPKGIKLFLRFFDFTKKSDHPSIEIDQSTSFELNAGLISALFEFAKNMDKKIQNLVFISKTDQNVHPDSNEREKYKGDVIITVQTETYLLPKSVQQKIKLIYDSIISLKTPLESANIIEPNEEQKITDILTDTIAREHVSKIKNESEIRFLANDFLKEMGGYGLESICITSFDLSPIKVFGEKYSFEDIGVILRNIGAIPDIVPLEWIYRQSFFKDRQTWVYLINSGMGVTVEGLFEPFYYLLFADPQSYLGEFPGKLTAEFNLVLG